MRRTPDKEIARVKSLFALLDLKPKDVCRDTGIKPNLLSMHLNGERPLTLNAALLIAHTYGVTLDWIFRGDPSGLPERLADLRKVR